jgi:APA family basic amino acid/polyamine antiporter
MAQVKTLLHQLVATKPIDSGTTSASGSLRRCLTAFDLTLLGVGAIIGAGIFVLTGIAAAEQAGPAIIFSYLLAGLACCFCALAYAELSSSVGGCGSAYGYSYASLGELVAWLIGWDLLLEYGMDGATVAIGWAGYVQAALHAFGVNLPLALTNDPWHGGIINLPAVLIIGLLAVVLSAGSEESSRFNKIIVLIKMVVIGLFVVIGATHFTPENWHPFLPFGVQGIVNGAGFIFFAYIGFDAVSTAAEEAINPQRDLPIGIMASLVICTTVYIIVAGLLTSMVKYPELNVASPVATALIRIGYTYSAEIIAFGAIAGLTSVVLVMYFGATRIFLAMARDGLLPAALTHIHQKSQTPRRLIWLIGALMAVSAGFFPITQIANLVNIGTLMAFVVVCIGVIVLRVTKPNMPRPFKTPFNPYFPLIGIFLCLYLMTSLPRTTWISFGIWTGFGLVIYFGYSRRHSILKLEHQS